MFYQSATKDRLQKKFNRAYRYFEVLFDGENPYVTAIRRNLTHLIKVLKTDRWDLLRREPPYFVGETDAEELMDTAAYRLLSAIPTDQAEESPDRVPA